MSTPVNQEDSGYSQISTVHTSISDGNVPLQIPATVVSPATVPFIRPDMRFTQGPRVLLRGAPQPMRQMRPFMAFPPQMPRPPTSGQPVQYIATRPQMTFRPPTPLPRPPQLFQQRSVPIVNRGPLQGYQYSEQGRSHTVDAMHIPPENYALVGDAQRYPSSLDRRSSTFINVKPTDPNSVSSNESAYQQLHTQPITGAYREEVQPPQELSLATVGTGKLTFSSSLDSEDGEKFINRDNLHISTSRDEISDDLATVSTSVQLNRSFNGSGGNDSIQKKDSNKAVADNKSEKVQDSAHLSTATTRPKSAINESKITISKTSEISTTIEKKKVPMNKIQVGNAPSPNLKAAKSKIGSLEKADHKPGGGNVKIETKKVEFKKLGPRIEAKNESYTPKGGDKKIPQQKIQWTGKSRIGSLDNASYQPKGGEKKIETQKLDFKERAQSKVGSRDNITHVAGGGDVKIETRKVDYKVQSKIGSMDNLKHKPGGGDKRIFDDKEYLKQMSSSVSETHSLASSQRCILTETYKNQYEIRIPINGSDLKILHTSRDDISILPDRPFSRLTRNILSARRKQNTSEIRIPWRY